jgi:hypothetical protein
MTLNKVKRAAGLTLAGPAPDGGLKFKISMGNNGSNFQLPSKYWPFLKSFFNNLRKRPKQQKKIKKMQIQYPP